MNPGQRKTLLLAALIAVLVALSLGFAFAIPLP